MKGVQVGKGMKTEEQGVRVVLRGLGKRRGASQLRKLKKGENFIQHHERFMRRGARKYED